MKRHIGLPLVLVLLALALLPVAAAAAASKPSLANHQVEAVLELKHPRGLNRFVRAVSDPSSPHYRRYATVSELVHRFGADEKEQKQVLGWFSRRGVHARLMRTGSFVVASLDAERAARLLAGASASASTSAATAVAGRVPVGLRGAVSRVDLVSAADRVHTDIARAQSPLAGASAAKGKKKPAKPYSSILKHSGSATGCPEGRLGGYPPPLEPFTPNQYLGAYGHTALHRQGYEGQGQTMAVVEYGGFKRSDVETFAKCFGTEVPPLQVVPVIPAHKPLPPQDETTLDLEMISAGAPKLDRVRVYEGGGSTTDIAISMAAALGKPGAQPNVISISLGVCEPTFSGQLALKNAYDNALAIAAGAGISVLVSAGDQGSSGCRAGPPGEENTELPVLAVSLPASSPYATAVGGTNLQLGKKNAIQEQLTWNDSPLQPSGTGGGSSVLNPHRPWWQNSVHRYGLGRIVPDVSALADIFPGYAIFCTAPSCSPAEWRTYGWASFGGTSAAAPLTAAGIALSDQYAEAHGQPPLGFLNPLVYELGARAKTRAGVFDDVTKGNNDLGRLLPENVGGGLPLGCCSARKGYDWATGWGSLKLVGFAKAAAALAPRPSPIPAKK